MLSDSSRTRFTITSYRYVLPVVVDCVVAGFLEGFLGFQQLENFPPIDYTPYEVSQINWAVGIGTALGTVPFSELYTRFGAKYPFLVAMLVSSLATFLFPWAAEWKFEAMLVLRFFQASAGILAGQGGLLRAR